jgi:hypothetical protein
MLTVGSFRQRRHWRPQLPLSPTGASLALAIFWQASEALEHACPPDLVVVNYERNGTRDFQHFCRSIVGEATLWSLDSCKRAIRSAGDDHRHKHKSTQMMCGPLVIPPTPVPVLTSVSVPPPMLVKAPPTSVPMHQLHRQFEQWRINLRAISWLVQVCILEKAGIVITLYFAYPMMFPSPHYATTFYPVLNYGYAPMFYGPPGIVCKHHHKV